MQQKSTTDIAKPTITEVLDAFLDDQESRLAPKTFDLYESVVNLLKRCINWSGPNDLDEARAKLLHQHQTAVGDAHREFCDVFGPEFIEPNFNEFLTYFLEERAIARAATIRAAGPVTRKLSTWLAARDAAGGMAVDKQLTPSKIANALDAFAQKDRLVDLKRRIEDVFAVTRIDKGDLWLEFQEEEIGPFDVPVVIARQLKVGWTISATICHSVHKWRLAEVWSVRPL